MVHKEVRETPYLQEEGCRGRVLYTNSVRRCTMSDCPCSEMC